MRNGGNKRDMASQVKEKPFASKINIFKKVRKQAEDTRPTGEGFQVRRIDLTRFFICFVSFFSKSSILLYLASTAFSKAQKLIRISSSVTFYLTVRYYPTGKTRCRRKQFQ